MAFIGIYCEEKISPRHVFAFESVFGVIGKHRWEATSVLEDKKKYTHFFYYTSDKTNSIGNRIIPYGLLSEHTIKPVHPEVREHDIFRKIFFVTNTSHPVPFDIFSAVFWILGRYEEYTADIPTVTGDFSHRSSLAWQNEFLDFPLVQHWVREFFRIFSVPFSPAPARVQILVDMLADNDFNKHLPLPQNLKRIVPAPFQNVMEKLYMLRGRITKRKDEFLECFSWFHTLMRANRNFRFIFFWNTANESGNPHSLLSMYPFLQIPAKRLNDYGGSGVLVRGNEDIEEPENTFPKFILRLKNILHTEIENIRITKGYFMASSVQRHVHLNGIRHDYSGLYYHAAGYRFSCAVPVPYLDLEKNRITDLWLHPVVVQDNFLFASDDAGQMMFKIKENILTYGGECNILLHLFNYAGNYSGIQNREKIIKWMQIFEDILS